MDERHLIFLSYASPDRERVFEYYDFFSNKNFQVWMDKRSIKGGQNWEFEIKRALQKAAIIIVFLSRNSVNRRGYVQREIKIALDQARDKLIDDIYIIPVMLDTGVPVPAQLDDIHILRPEDGDTMQAAAEAIELQLRELGAEAARIQGESELRWTLTTHKDSWDGLPGYEVEYQLPRFHSDVYPQVSEITDIIRGWLLSQAMGERAVKYEQDCDSFNFGQNRFQRQNSWEASCGDPKIKARVATVAYSIWWYGAGAAHPNHGFKTFTFTLDPVTQINRLESIFKVPQTVLPCIQAAVRESLLAERFEGMTSDDEPLALDPEWVERGTEAWDDFTNFVFGDDGIEILFGSYHVAPYAFGPQTAVVPYEKIALFMKKHFACALGVEHLQSGNQPWPFQPSSQAALENKTSG